MKVLKKWLGSTERDPGEEPRPDSASGVAADYATPDKPDARDEDTSFNWRTLDTSSSSIFDSPDTHRIRVLKQARVRPANDDNPGYDPYDTGRFVTDDDDDS